MVRRPEQRLAVRLDRLRGRLRAAAWLVGLLAERGGDRTPLRAAGIMVVGNLVIYLFGVTGLLLMTPFDLPTAIAKGVVPFLLGDAIKIVAAAALLPAA